MTEKAKYNWIYWISIILSFPFIPLSLGTGAAGIFLYGFFAYLSIWLIAWFVIYIKVINISVRRILFGLFLILVFPCIYGFLGTLLVFKDQYHYRRADGTLTQKGLESGLRLIPPSNCNCTYIFINFELKNDSIQFEMKNGTSNIFNISDVIYVRDVNYSDSQMIEIILTDIPKPNRLSNESYYYSDFDKYKDLIVKNDYKRLQELINSKENARERRK